MLVIILILDVIVKFRPFQYAAFRFGYFRLVNSVPYKDSADPHYLDEK